MTPNEVRELHAAGHTGTEIARMLVMTGGFTQAGAEEYVDFVLHGGDVVWDSAVPTPAELPNARTG